MTTSTRGFTLLELLVVIAIAGILFAVGLPGLRELAASGARREASTSLYSALNRARSEAIARNREVRVCSRSLTSPTPACSDTLNWANGALVFVPMGSDLLPLAESPPISTSLELRTAPTAILSFSASGRPTQAAEFLLCAAQRQHNPRARRIRVQRSGNLSLEEAATCS